MLCWMLHLAVAMKSRDHASGLPLEQMLRDLSSVGDGAGKGAGTEKTLDF